MREPNVSKSDSERLVDPNKYDLEIQGPKHSWRARGAVALVIAGVLGLASIGGVSATETPWLFALCVLAVVLFGTGVYLIEQRNKSG